MKPVTSFDSFPTFGDAGSRQAPGDAKYAAGFESGETFPAEWANYFFHGSTKGVTDLNSAVSSIWNELNSILTAYGISADITSTGQLLAAINKIYPSFTTCSTAAATQNKSVAITGNILKAGNTYVIEMTYGNTYGDGSTTYPTLSINSGTAYPICDSNGAYVGKNAWSAGDTIRLLFTGSRFLMATQGVVNKIERDNMHPIASGAVAFLTASSTTITGPVIANGSPIKILFTADVTGADTTTGLTINYNGQAYNVMVGKQGSLAALTAHEVATSTYKYIQAYTSLELLFDGTQFIIVGNPVVLSSANYTIYADGYFEGPQIFMTTSPVINSNNWESSTGVLKIPFTVKNASRIKVLIAQVYCRVGVGLTTSCVVDLTTATSIVISFSVEGSSGTDILYGTYNATSDTWVCTSIRNLTTGLGSPLFVAFI